jgi:hypothetical protein
MMAKQADKSPAFPPNNPAGALTRLASAIFV